jgi:hypothetical protein
MTHPVFISYATDDSVVAERICQLLERQGVPCWVAPRDVPPGCEWPEAITKAIANAPALVLVLSEHANQSDFVVREVSLAADRPIPVFPVRIREVAPSGRVALFIGAVQWLDAFTPPIDQQIAKLAEAIRPLIGEGPELPPPPPPASQRRTAPWLLLLVLSFLCPFLGSAAWQFLCKWNQWSFYLGGPRNEPYGLYAFIWGVVVFLPIVLILRILTSERRLNTPAAVFRWFVSRESALVLAYVGLAGLAAVFFYGVRPDSGCRAWVTAWDLTPERTEQVLLVLWAISLSVLPPAAILLLGGQWVPRLGTADMLLYALPAVLSALASLVALAFYFGSYDHSVLDPHAQIRGAAAGWTMRFAVFWGLWMAIDRRNAELIVAGIRNRLNRPFR